MTDRQHLVCAIAFAPTQCKRLFRTMAQRHNTDEAPTAAAEIIADRIEQTIEVRSKPPLEPHRIPPA